MRLPFLLSLIALVALSPREEPVVGRQACLPLGEFCELRIERFVIESRSTDERGRVRMQLEGFVEWRRRDGKDGPQLERDVRFLRGTVTDGKRDVQRVLEVELLTARGPRCQWREVGMRGGRSVQAEWAEDGRALDIVEWSQAGKKRGTLVASGGASMPLYLAELVRQGRITAGGVTQFDPLARTLEPLMVRTVWLESSDAAKNGDGVVNEDVATSTESGASVPAEAALAAEPNARAAEERTVELLRADGTLAARYRFAGLALVGFQWQEGRLSARAVDEGEFERLVAENVPTIAAQAHGWR